MSPGREPAQPSLRADSARHWRRSNDFYSYRARKTRLFPEWHQDTAFWLVGGVCTGFNLWMLLEQRGGLNRSFELYDTDENAQFYPDVYSRGGRGREVAPGARTLWPPATFANSFAGHLSGMARQGRPLPRASSFELSPGDALVVRQPEIHRTDTGTLEPAQWRLALGFKVIERLPLVRGPLETSPFSVDMQKVRLRFPALLPPLNLGAPFPDVYDGARLAAYRARPDTWRTHAGRLLEDRPELAMLLVPVSFAVVASLALALRAGLRGTETARMRGARRKE